MASSNSMSELLAVTDAAVKALNRSSKSLSSTSGSNSSRCSQEAVNKQKKLDPFSKDSGISKTQKNELDASDVASEVSTSASDVLIRSTIADLTENSLLANGRDEVSSVVSKCSKTSFGSENFNTSGSYKVRVSTKKLREVKSPFESPRDVLAEKSVTVQKISVEKHDFKSSKEFKENTNLRSSKEKKELQEKLQVLKEKKDDLLKGKTKGKDPKPQTVSVSAVKNDSPRSAVSDESKQSRPLSAPRGLTELEKMNSNMQNTSNMSNESEFTASLKESSKNTSQNSRSQQDLRGVEFSPSDKSTGASPGVYIQRHTPRKKHPQERKKLFEDECYESASGSELGSKGKGDVNGSLDLEPTKESAADNKVKINSSVSSQESGTSVSNENGIYTVPERIVTVAARTSASTDNSYSDVESTSEGNIPPKLPNRLHALSKLNSAVLKQGAAEDSGDDLRKCGQSPEIRISNYKLSQKEKEIRQTFTKRYENPGPVRRIVQPRIIKKNMGNTSEDEQHLSKSASVSDSMAAAVAASAAVAVTQPFLKAQQELESKMAEILEKMAQLQSGVQAGPSAEEDYKSQRMLELEKQVSQMTEQRISYLEKLQENQLNMQAQLLSMNQKNQKPRSRSASPSRTPPSRRNCQSSEEVKQAFSKTRVHRSTSPAGRKSPFERTASPLDTPAPRSKAPKPLAYNAHSKSKKSDGILEQILAGSLSPKENGKIVIQNPSLQREQDVNLLEKSPNVKKAEKLVKDLSNVNETMTNLVYDVQHSPGKSKQIAEKGNIREITTADLYGPAPLDAYLVKPEQDPKTPYKAVPHLSPSKFNAPVYTPLACHSAKEILQQVDRHRDFLEENLQSVIRAREEMQVYTLLENLYQESSNKDYAKIQKQVTEWVKKIRQQIDREITDDIIVAEMEKKHIKPLAPSKAGVPKVQSFVSKQGARRAGIQARTDSGLQKIERDTKFSYTKMSKARETNKVSKKMEMDESYITHVYGKAPYHNKRTTSKEPYLHFQNTAKPKSPGRPTATQEVQGKPMMSSKTQTHAVRQFYFSPASGSYIPVASVGNSVPIAGQLIPMAVPLSGPRMDKGMKATERQPESPGPITSTPLPKAQVTADRNVALVSVPAPDLDEDIEHQAELGKQVLPPVDIDTDVSEGTEGTAIISKSGNVYLKSPQKSPPPSPKHSHFEAVHHSQKQSSGDNWAQGLESSYEDTFEEDISPEDAQGIALPGYCPPSPPPAEAREPDFPPKVQGAGQLARDSDLIAEDIKRKDLLENQATQWIEQEIMAQIISKMYPLQEPAQPKEMDHVVEDESDDSLADQSQNSMFVMDAIGRDGLQMFVDVGQPIDNTLVNALVREVLTEKVVTMLGQRPDEEGVREAKPREEGKIGAHAKTETAQKQEIGFKSEDEYVGQVRTPQPTPKGSPRTSPIRVISPPVTPAESPRPVILHVPAPEEERISQQPVRVPSPDLEPESASYNISEELRILKEKLKSRDQTTPTQQQFGVDTPIATPVPDISLEEEVEKPVSPPIPSPRRHVEVPVEVPVAVPMVAAIPEPVLSASIVHPPELDMEHKLQVPRDPQPWGNPDSPLPEENPDYYEGYAPQALDGTKPLALSVAHAEESIGYQPSLPVQPPKSPSPGRPRSATSTPSDTETTSLASSVSDTENMSISEGQWLLSKSEGEVANFQMDEAAARRMAQQSKYGHDFSVASTTKDAEEIQNESAEPISEGEFQYKSTAYTPENDPLLTMLSRLQSQKAALEMMAPSYQAQPYVPTNGRQDGFDTTGRSMGEISFQGNGGNGRQGHREVIKVSEHAYEKEDAEEKPSDQSSFFQDWTARNTSPLRMTDLKRESIQEETEEELMAADRSQRSDRSAHSKSEPKGETPSQQKQPSKGRQSPVKSRMSSSPGGVSIGAGILTPGKKPPQAAKSQGIPEKSVTQGRFTQLPTKDENIKDSAQTLDGIGTLSETGGSKTYTSDQMNMDSLIQSGYLYQNLSQSGDMGQSGALSSQEYSSRQQNKGKSLGLTYSFEEQMQATDSLDESELRHLAATGTLKMSVTLPSTGDEDKYAAYYDEDMTDPSFA